MTQQTGFPTANHAAFLTVTSLAVVTGGATFMAATSVATVATVAYTVLAVTAGALSMASITAWVSKDSISAKAYFNNLKNHAGYAIAGTFQFVAQTILTALIYAIRDGFYTLVRRKIAGPDVTVGAR